MRRPKQTGREDKVWLSCDMSESELTELASEIHYDCSATHKKHLGAMGSGKLGAGKQPAFRRKRKLATICPKEITDESSVNAWLKEAIHNKAFSQFNKGSLPRKVWYYQKSTATLFEAVSSSNNEYHGFPLEDRKKWPIGIEDIYDV